MVCARGEGLGGGLGVSSWAFGARRENAMRSMPRRADGGSCRMVTDEEEGLEELGGFALDAVSAFLPAILMNRQIMSSSLI